MSAPDDVTASLRAVGADDICGSWEIVSLRRTAIATGVVSEPFGRAPRGYITYTPDGRMNAIFVGDERPSPVAAGRETDAERAALHRSMCAYAGTWRLDGRIVWHRVDVSWNQSWTGTDVMRLAGLDDAGQLVLSSGLQPAIVDGSMGVAVATWRRSGPARALAA
jgi:hypothetical protein